HKYNYPLFQNRTYSVISCHELKRICQQDPSTINKNNNCKNSMDSYQVHHIVSDVILGLTNVICFILGVACFIACMVLYKRQPLRSRNIMYYILASSGFILRVITSMLELYIVRMHIDPSVNCYIEVFFGRPIWYVQ